MPFHLIPEKEILLTWFNTSPDVGDPSCTCSLCGKRIERGTLPLRIFRKSNNTEARLHIDCANLVIKELQKGDSRET